MHTRVVKRRSQGAEGPRTRVIKTNERRARVVESRGVVKSGSQLSVSSGFLKRRRHARRLVQVGEP